MLSKLRQFSLYILYFMNNKSWYTHKLVLSACSSFFKNIFKRNSHSHPLLYLGGVSFDNLEFILDYIYQGEVLILQEQLDDFLETAKTLNITGLIGDDNYDDQPTLSEPKQQFETKPGRVQTEPVHVVESLKNEKVEGWNFKSRIVEKIEIQNPADIKEKIKELTEKVDGGFQCKSCGKITMNKTNHKRHVETHLEGLSFPCEFCDKVFRYSNSRNIHIHKHHKNRNNWSVKWMNEWINVY